MKPSFESYLRRFYGAKSTKRQKPNRPIAKFAIECYEKLLLEEDVREALINLVEMRNEARKQVKEKKES